MFSKYTLVLALLFTTAQSLAADYFKVAPYSLRHTNGHLLLNFELNQNQKLEIMDGTKVIPAHDYKKGEHYQIELAIAECNTAKDLRIKNSANEEIIFDKTFPEFKCSPNPSASEYAFGFISDTLDQSQRHQKIAKVVARHHAEEPLQFMINDGDVVENGDKESDWLNYFKGGDAYLTDIPQITAIGNHDYKGQANENLPRYFQKFMRWDGADKNGNLFYQMPGFQLIVWNSNTPDLKKSEEESMLKWMEATLKAAQLKDMPVVVATHFPVYSSSINRWTNSGVRKLRKHLVPLFEKYHVQLVLSGHTHMFEKSYKDGVTYLVAGPAGGKINHPTLKNKYQQSFNSDSLTFTKIKYLNGMFVIQTFDENDKLIDQLYINL